MSNPKEELQALRNKIDDIDQGIIALFRERMAVVGQVAGQKQAANMGVTDEGRERQVLQNAAKLAGEGLENSAMVLMSTLMALSRGQQAAMLYEGGKSLLPPPQRSAHPRAAFQGVPGAWGEQAARSLFPDKELVNYELFEDVFRAVKEGEAGHGALPLENAQTGAIGEVYDLLRRHGCFIVGQAWVEIRHCLLVRPGTRMEDIRKVMSHPEGFRQCYGFLKGHPWDRTTCTNTAVAAQQVAARNDNRGAAVGSRRAAEIYGLEVLASDIMDSAQNRTRFISIAKEPWYDENSDTISVTFSTAHKSGALCQVLQAFMTAGINLSRIESRPVAGGKYRFFADLQATVLSKETQAALHQAAGLCEYFEVLGCYHA